MVETYWDPIEGGLHPMSLDAPTEAPFATALPPLTDEEAHHLIGRFARLDDEERALDANYKAMKKDLDGRREWLQRQDNHEERLREWALGKLKGRSRTVRTLHGVVSFRTVPARIGIANELQAREWAREHRPELLVERVDAKGLKLDAFATVNPEAGEAGYAVPEGFAVTPGRETFSVKSGAKTEGNEDE